MPFLFYALRAGHQGRISWAALCALRAALPFTPVKSGRLLRKGSWKKGREEKKERQKDRQSDRQTDRHRRTERERKKDREKGKGSDFHHGPSHFHQVTV
jgi:hypothetical protein